MDLKDEIDTLRFRVSTLNSDISQGQQAIASLEKEKRDLQALVSQYQNDISTRKSKHQDYQKQISEANRVQGEIVTLRGVAESTTSNIKDVNCELQNIKECLDEFSSLIQAKSIDVSTSEAPVDRIAGVIGIRSVSTKIRRAKEFKKQKEVMQQVSETLEKVNREVPQLLSSQETTFLDIKPWNATAVPTLEINDEIP